MMVMSLWGIVQIVNQQWGQNLVLVLSGVFLLAMAILMVILGLFIMAHHFKLLRQGSLKSMA